MRPRLCLLAGTALLLITWNHSRCAGQDAWGRRNSAPTKLSRKSEIEPIRVTTPAGTELKSVKHALPGLPANVIRNDEPSWETGKSRRVYLDAQSEIQLVSGAQDWTDVGASDVPAPPEWHADAPQTSWFDDSAGRFRGAVGELWQDQCGFYSRDSLFVMAVGVAAMAPIANTNADRGIRNRYQEKLRSSATDDFAETFRDIGDQWHVIPIFAAASLSGRLIDEWNPDAGETLSVWGDRSARALIVGTPPLLFGQKLLGAGRPEEGSSHWSLWDDSNAVSGHAFVGAIPFLTAAEMTESPFLRTAFYVASPAVGFTRINDDAHYFSQVVLGWGLAWVSTRAVARKHTRFRCVRFLPYDAGGRPGLSISASY